MSTQSQQQLIETPSWLQQYRPLANCYDEYLGENASPRPHWQPLDQALNQLDDATWQRRESQLGQLIESNGITYNVYGHDQSNKASWSVDMLPHLVAESDFKILESGLSQRAKLLNMVLEDFYGRQNILKGKHIDPFLVLANPAFNRPCHGLLGAKENHLNIYAVDVARSASGKWWVLNDRVEAVSGLGYAMDNRMLLSRIFPNLIQRVGAKRLNPFFDNFCAHIGSLAQQNTHQPNIALLSPGPKNETYYEHSFLARNLGFTLAEGADLTVRDNRLYMKTIAGTQQVDVLLRRVDSSWSDPLEMRNDSLLGVPGLVNCVRQGNLSIANALGSGLAETPAIPAFLPWLSANFLGESLEIPSIATWWCGQSSELQYVLENLHQLAIKPTFRNHDSPSYYGPDLNEQELASLRSEILRRPKYFCAQEILKTATTPVLTNNRVEPRPYLLRLFLIPDSKGEWKMMPGGFARCAPNAKGYGVSMQIGGSSKDVWIVPNSGQSEQSPPLNTPASSVRKSAHRRTIDLPSRTADNLFWLGRYIERAEMQTRLLRTTINLIVSEQIPEVEQACRPFIQQLNQFVPVSMALNEDGIKIDQVESNIRFGLNGETNANSLVSNLKSIERIAESLKERLSVDSWKRILTIKRLSANALSLKTTIYDQECVNILDTSLESLASLNGDIAENMTRGQGWIFMQLGRRIERGLTTTKLLKEVFKKTEQFNETLLHHFLELIDCSITYRRRYLNTLNPIAVLDMAVFDHTNPRSLMFQAERIREQLTHLPQHTSGTRSPTEIIATQLFSQIGITDAVSLVENGSEGFYASLIEKFTQISIMLETGYFAHTQTKSSSENPIPLS